MKRIGLLASVVLLARSAKGEDAANNDRSSPDDDANKISCRVAVCLSGHVRSFVHPMVPLSIRRNVIEAIEDGGCSVDVFAYAALEDTDILVEQEEENSGYMQNVDDVKASMQTLAPTRLVWHQEQAGLIPNSCPENLSGGTTSAKKHNGALQESGGSSKDDWKRKVRDEDGPNLYWQLYMSRAAYRLALEEEVEKSFVYDWIVHARFDATWISPIPPLSLFSREAVWLDARSWPASDDFALVPRVFSDRFFSAISTYYACDSSSWPPAESWWNPHCDGNGFEESVLFQYLHASGVGYRMYPMFDYVPTPPHRQEGGKCDKKKSAYTSACILLDTWRLLPPNFSGGDCIAALSGWSDLRCETFLSGAGTGNHQKAEALLHPGRRAWEHLPDALAADGTAGDADRLSSRENLRVARSKLAAVRDAILLAPSALERTSLGDLDSRQPGRDGWDLGPAWLIHSQEGCHVEEYAGRAPHLVRIYTVDPSLAEEMALAMKCFAHRLVEGEESGDANFDATICAGVRPLELVMIDVSARSAELGICTADGSLRLRTGEHVQRFFADPAAYCVGYGRATAPQFPATTAGGSGEEVDATVGVSTVEPISRPTPEEVTRGVAAVREAGEMAAPAEAVAVAAAVAAVRGPVPEDGEASVTRVLREHDRGIASVEGLDSWEGDKPSTQISMFSSPSCSDLMVQAMTVTHPKEGAVYWEGPVRVEMELTLTGPGLRGLGAGDVHVCADTEEAWPVLDWSRSCVTLEQLASLERPFLVFGSTIGVVVGSISVRDARPACIPEGSLRGSVLPMEEAHGVDGEIASERVRFKIIHHKSTLERRGRPLGVSSLGRGFATVEEYIQDLEREADEEASTALDEMQSYVNLTHGTNIQLKGERCGSKLLLHQRGSSLIASSFQVHFFAEQLDWMLANGKLPSGMVVAADRMKELLLSMPDETSPSYHSMAVLEERWRSVAPFYQKALLFPAPALERVVSTTPLHTWEYDEIPWMEALNPDVDWNAVEEAYLGNTPVELAYVDDFFSPKALAVLLDMAYGSTFFFDNRQNYIGAYPSDGMSHPLLYQIAEEAAERLPRIVGRGTPGWPLVQSWIYVYGGNDGERCTRGIKVHADTAMVNLNVWLAPDSANLGSAETNDGGGLTVFHAKPPADWSFQEFNRNPDNVNDFLEENDAGNTSVPHRQNRALLFDSMLFHQSDPFRFKKGFGNKRINLTLLFGPQKQLVHYGEPTAGAAAAAAAAAARLLDHDAWYTDPKEMREVQPENAGELLYCL